MRRLPYDPGETGCCGARWTHLWCCGTAYERGYARGFPQARTTRWLRRRFGTSACCLKTRENSKRCEQLSFLQAADEHHWC